MIAIVILIVSVYGQEPEPVKVFNTVEECEAMGKALEEKAKPEEKYGYYCHPGYIGRSR
jgi:hypothetical protein